MKLILFSSFLFLLTACLGIEPKQTGKSKTVSHQLWNELLKENVKDGRVNYKGFIEDSAKLNQYLELLSSNHPNNQNWTESEQLAYWINAYNAFTVRLIIRNYPLKSIKDIAGAIPFINSPWDIKFIKIEEETYDLNNIEHGIIRSQFKEPRIHFALNCASFSCPFLRNEAYEASELERQLEEQTRIFINDPSKNFTEGKSWKISKIFLWYGSDFKSKSQNKKQFILKYLNQKTELDPEIDYLDYDWTLNE